MAANRLLEASRNSGYLIGVTDGRISIINPHKKEDGDMSVAASVDLRESRGIGEFITLMLTPSIVITGYKLNRLDHLRSSRLRVRQVDSQKLALVQPSITEEEETELATFDLEEGQALDVFLQTVVSPILQTAGAQMDQLFAADDADTEGAGDD